MRAREEKPAQNAARELAYKGSHRVTKFSRRRTAEGILKPCEKAMQKKQ